MGGDVSTVYQLFGIIFNNIITQGGSLRIGNKKFIDDRWRTSSAHDLTRPLCTLTHLSESKKSEMCEMMMMQFDRLKPPLKPRWDRNCVCFRQYGAIAI